MANEWRWYPAIQCDNVILTLDDSRCVIEAPTINGLGAQDFNDHKIPLRDGAVLTGRSEKAITTILAGRITGYDGSRSETACLAFLALLKDKLRGNTGNNYPGCYTVILYRQWDTGVPGWTANYIHFRHCTCEDTSFDVTNVERDGIPFEFASKSEDSDWETGTLPDDDSE